MVLIGPFIQDPKKLIHRHTEERERGGENEKFSGIRIPRWPGTLTLRNLGFETIPVLERTPSPYVQPPWLSVHSVVVEEPSAVGHRW